MIGVPAAYQQQAIPPPNPQALLVLTSRGNSSQLSGVEAKRKLTGKFILPETHVANHIVKLEPQQSKTINSSASTPSMAPPQPLPPTHGPVEGTPLPDPAPPASIHGLALSALTLPSLTRMTSVPPLHSGPTGSGTLTSS